jgi:hypothetical protein
MVEKSVVKWLKCLKTILENRKGNQREMGDLSPRQ